MTSKNNMQKYQSISCSYYDQLEAYATKRTHCSIVFTEETEKTTGGIIVDIFAKNGAEYLKLDNGTIVRLDQLISINGIPVSNIC